MTTHPDPINSSPRVDPRHFGWNNTGGEPLYLGGLTGYRYWRITPEGNLRSISQGFTWNSGKTLTAECLLDKGHPAPNDGCRCGFYAWYTPEEARRNHMNSGYGIHSMYFPYTSSALGIVVLGAAFMSGLIVPGTEGMRAESVKPLGVVITTIKHKARVATFRENYPSIKIFPSSDALIKHFPPEEDIPWANPRRESKTQYYISEDEIECLTGKELLSRVFAAVGLKKKTSQFMMSGETFQKLRLIGEAVFHLPHDEVDSNARLLLLLGIPVQLNDDAKGILLEEV